MNNLTKVSEKNDLECLYINASGCDLMVVRSMPILAKHVSFILIHGDVYTIQHYVTIFVNDVRQVGGFY